MHFFKFFAANIHNLHMRRAQRQATVRPDPPQVDWFVTGRVVPVNPGGSLRVPATSSIASDSRGRKESRRMPCLPVKLKRVFE
jgi:hypothetical protein